MIGHELYTVISYNYEKHDSYSVHTVSTAHEKNPESHICSSMV